MHVNKREIISRIKRAGFTQEQVAKQLGISYVTFYRRLDSGAVAFTVKDLYRLMEILSISKQEVVELFFTE